MMTVTRAWSPPCQESSNQCHNNDNNDECMLHCHSPSPYLIAAASERVLVATASEREDTTVCFGLDAKSSGTVLHRPT